jgi:AcrR family transcriptional regulator
MDRRTQRTHDVLHRALMSLIVEKSYEVITVQDVIDRANVGRSTFYTHYLGKQDLLRAGLKHLKAQLQKSQQAGRTVKGDLKDRLFSFSLALFVHVDSYKAVYHAIVGRQSGTIVMSELRALLAELIETDLKMLPTSDRRSDVPRSALTQFVVGALLSVITWWVDERSKLSPVEANEIFRRLILPSFGQGVPETNK